MADDLDAMFPIENQVEAPAEPVADSPTPEPATPATAPAETVEVQPSLQAEITDKVQDGFANLADGQQALEAAPEPRQPGYVPLAAVLDERDKRKALEARIAQFEAQQPKPAAPDPYDQPEQFAAYQQTQFQSALQQQKVDMSWTLAVRDYGKQAAEAAKTWATEKAQADPIFMQQLDVAFQTETLPIDWLVQQHKRDALLSDIGDPSKLDDWFAREAAKRGYQPQSAPVGAAPIPVVAQVQSAPKAVPPRSIASDAAPASNAPTDGKWDVFDGLLPR